MAGDPIAEYEAMWRSLKWWQRLGHRIWWKAATVWAGIVGGITPGERLVLRAWSTHENRRRNGVNDGNYNL